MQRLCCCCGDKSEKKHPNESVVVVNDEGAITTQPTNKSANNSFKFNRSNGSLNDGFVNDAVEFDEIDLNERQMSGRSRDKVKLSNGHCPPSSQKPAEETIHVTGLMLDQLYEDDEKEEDKTQKQEDNCQSDDLSREIVEDYNVDSNVISEVTPADLNPPEEHKLTINLSDEATFCYCSDKSSLTSETAEPVAAPRTKSSSPNSVPPESPQTPPWSPIKDCPNDETVHETAKCPLELGTHDLELAPNEFSEQPTTSVSSAPSDPAADDLDEHHPPYPANNDQVIHEHIQKNRMYVDLSSSSSSCDSDEPNEFELDSLQTTDRQHKKDDDYSILHEETDKSNAG